MMQLQLFTDPAPPVQTHAPCKRRERSASGKAVTARTTNAERFGAMLRASGLPHVAVDEVKRATIRDAKLKSFDFIVYAETGANWLLYVGPRRKSMVEAMGDWEATFGDGFRALFLVSRGDALVYRTLDGETVVRPFDTEA